jgi:hypothetical protein
MPQWRLLQPVRPLVGRPMPPHQPANPLSLRRRQKQSLFRDLHERAVLPTRPASSGIPIQRRDSDGHDGIR